MCSFTCVPSGPVAGNCRSQSLTPSTVMGVVMIAAQVGLEQDRQVLVRNSMVLLLRLWILTAGQQKACPQKRVRPCTHEDHLAPLA